VLRIGMRVRFVPQQHYWHDPECYEPPPGTEGVVTFIPKPNAFGGCVGVEWDTGQHSYVCGLNACSLLPT